MIFRSLLLVLQKLILFPSASMIFLFSFFSRGSFFFDSESQALNSLPSALVTRLGRDTEPPTSSQCSLSAAPMPSPGYYSISFTETLEHKRDMADRFWSFEAPTLDMIPSTLTYS